MPFKLKYTFFVAKKLKSGIILISMDLRMYVSQWIGFKNRKDIAFTYLAFWLTFRQWGPQSIIVPESRLTFAFFIPFLPLS